MIDWPQIFYGASLTAIIVAVVFAIVLRERAFTVIFPAVVAAFLGPLTWNAILHRAATDADAFFVDIPFKPFPVSWQDTGSGVFALAIASLALGSALHRDRAGRVLRLALVVAAVAFLVDIYLY